MSEHSTVSSTGGMSNGDAQDYQGLGSIVGNIASDVTTLVRQEAELAKAELKDEAAKATKAVGLFGSAGAAAHLGALFLTLALALGLAEWLDTDLGWTTLAVGLLWMLVAGVAFASGRNRMREVDPVPRKTIKTIKEGL
ncbi:MAG: phage holin family protein [Actinomycetes bacterium]|jgi:hypothetical protein